jgi:NADH-quinone oxidoreductase subunit H
VNVINNIFNILRDAIEGVLAMFLPDWLVFIIMVLIAISATLAFLTVVVMSLVWLERRAIAFMQDRLGPNRVGPFGMLQTVADVLKLLTKEDIIPRNADRPVFVLAAIAAVIPAVLLYAVVPFGPEMIIADLNIGVLYFLAVASLSTIAIIMAGWGSNNKFAMLGAMRGAAQVISYEIPIVLALVGVVMITGSLRMTDIVNAQMNSVWFVLLQPVGFLIFMVSSLAELNRTPFDLMEAESEIVAGYHTEYSGMRWSLFFLAEYLGGFAAAAIAVTLFLGGWAGPVLPPYVWFVIKVYGVFFFLIWMRGTLPRVRVDQLMNLAWKFMIPLALVNVVVTGIGIHLYRVMTGAA